METENKSKLKSGSLLRSFRVAISGIWYALRNERNLRLELLIFLAVIVAAFALRISFAEWLIIILVSGLVFTAELLNTAIEYLSDLVSAERDERIKRIKDIAAAGVLVAAVSAVVAGLIIFLPRLFNIIF